MPNERVQLKRLENEWVEIKSGKSVFKIVGMEAREFPQFPKFDNNGLSTIPASSIRQMIERTIFSVSTDETRYSLNGVFIEESKKKESKNGRNDGHRLAFEERI